LQFSFQVASPETFGYTLAHLHDVVLNYEQNMPHEVDNFIFTLSGTFGPQD